MDKETSWLYDAEKSNWPTFVYRWTKVQDVSTLQNTHRERERHSETIRDIETHPSWHCNYVYCISMQSKKCCRPFRLACFGLPAVLCAEKDEKLKYENALHLGQTVG